MKLNEPKVEIVRRGVNPTVDFTFSDNFCPCCGTNCQKIQVERFTREGFLFTYYGRKATIKCPSCETVFQKEICDNKGLTNLSDAVFLFSMIILMLSVLSLIIFSSLNITIGTGISLVIVIISFAVCGAAASD